jgi:hypothetical protein
MAAGSYYRVTPSGYVGAGVDYSRGNEHGAESEDKAAHTGAWHEGEDGEEDEEGKENKENAYCSPSPRIRSPVWGKP